MSETGVRRIWLCADDYGISPGVNTAIRELFARGRLNATSVMVVGPALDAGEIESLKAAVPQGAHHAIGLHATLTAPFRPLTMHFRPQDGGAFLPLPRKLRASLLRRLDAEMVQTEIAAQIAEFRRLFGRPPDYVDGHQHVQIFPQVRNGLLAAMREAAPQAWARQCGRIGPLGARLRMPKAMLLDTLSAGFRRAAAHAGITFNSGFAGAYDFTRQSDFPALMAEFLAGLPDGGLVMCHPGHVDQMLIDLDPLTDQRQREFDYLAGDAFERLLAQHRVTLS